MLLGDAVDLLEILVLEEDDPDAAEFIDQFGVLLGLEGDLLDGEEGLALPPELVEDLVPAPDEQLDPGEPAREDVLLALLEGGRQLLEAGGVQHWLLEPGPLQPRLLQLGVGQDQRLQVRLQQRVQLQQLPSPVLYLLDYVARQQAHRLLQQRHLLRGVLQLLQGVLQLPLDVLEQRGGHVPVLADLLDRLLQRQHAQLQRLHLV